MAMLMVLPKIAHKQWDCRCFVTETLLFLGRVALPRLVVKLASRPVKGGGVVDLLAG